MSVSMMEVGSRQSDFGGSEMGGGGVERFVYKQNSLGCVIIASTGGVIFELVVVFCAVSMSLKKKFCIRYLYKILIW